MQSRMFKLNSNVYLYIFTFTLPFGDVKTVGDDLVFLVLTDIIECFIWMTFERACLS